jgi:uncharacterized membrane protein
MSKLFSITGHSTSAVKALTWRVIATTITTLLVLLVTGHLTVALEVGVLDIITKLIAYYIHERAWLKFGRKSC